MLGRGVRVIGIYMPHGGYPDDCVEAMYIELESIFRDAARRGLECVVGGDFNAEVGILKESDPWYDPATLGNFGLTRRNQRGDWLIRFYETKKKTTWH